MAGTAPQTEVALEPKCPVCSASILLTTLYGRPMRALEGLHAGMFAVRCTSCVWSGYAPPDVARGLPRRGMYSRKRTMGYF